MSNNIVYVWCGDELRLRDATDAFKLCSEEEDLERDTRSVSAQLDLIPKDIKYLIDLPHFPTTRFCL